MFTRTTEVVVRLTTAPNPPIAHIWDQALASAGIRSIVVGDYLDAGLGDVPGMQPEIWVHRDDVQRAEQVLQQLHQSDAETPSSEDEEM